MRTLLAASVALLLSLALVTPADAAPDTGYPDTFSLRFGGFLVRDADIEFRLDSTSGALGTTINNDDTVDQALEAGAVGHVLKSDLASQLLSAVERAAAHRPYITPEIAPHVAGAERPLTMRELEAVRVLAEDRSNEEATAVLSISVRPCGSPRA